MIPSPDADLIEQLSSEDALWLFLDYDGTLADFAPTPDIVVPDKSLIALLSELAAVKQNWLTILSGRRLAHIQALVPIEGILKAGSYGLEMQMPDGRLLTRVDFNSVRPALDEVNGEWRALLAGRSGFFLEDKGWTLAIHAKDAAEEEAETVLSAARQLAAPVVSGSGQRLRLLGGHRFLEIAPVQADKRRSVEYLMEHYLRAGALPLYFGDDDKDEIAFGAVQAKGGLAFAVGDRLLNGPADYRFPSPRATRVWLAQLAQAQSDVSGRG